MKASVTIPDNLYKQAKSLTDNFSMLVTKALQEYIRTQKVEKARESFGNVLENGSTGKEKAMI